MDYRIPLFEKEVSSREWGPIDLSQENPELDFMRTGEPGYLDQFVRSHLSPTHPVAFGGYGEKRATYSKAAHFSELPDDEIRCIHLGVDFWTAEGTALLVPLDGAVHSFAFNDLPFDYGPTIILKHESDDGSFYTLYGHLSRDSLDNLKPGMRVTKGQVLGRIGGADINGGWSPHLHLQVIHDLWGWSGDFPGAASEKEKEKYLSNCPEPISFLSRQLRTQL